MRLTCRFVTQTPCSFARAWYVDIKALELVDLAYQDRTEWIKKSIRTTAKMGKFSSDRAIMDYAQEYWNLEPTTVA